MKLIVIGIDSLEPTLLEKFAPDLPNLTALRASSPKIHLSSIFPPDSIPAWISIYTGLNPAEHGIVYVFDMFNSQWQEILGLDIGVFKEKTFWDKASKAGKKVCVIFPMLAYPPWLVNGVMVSRSTDYRRVDGQPEWVVEREIGVFPTEARAQFNIPRKMLGVSGSPPPRSELALNGKIAQQALRDEGELGLKICADCEWDLFFITFSWLDTIQHLYWRYMDEEDPTYPGPNPHEDIIRDAYKILDEYVGKFKRLYAGVDLLVFSDHGHGIRPPLTVNINEYLRRRGYIIGKGPAFDLFFRILEAAKGIVLQASHWLELDQVLLRLSKKRGLSTISKNLYLSKASIDFKRSKAYLSTFAGPKSYGHGGIDINKEALVRQDYESLRSELIKDIQQLTHPKTGTPLVDWVIRREDLYHGKHTVKCYPDIVFQLKEGFGTYWGIYGGLISSAHDHHLSSGGHKREAVFLLSSECATELEKDLNLIDLPKIISRLLNHR